ncbi:hypothetical protein BDZ97DRAFT_1660224 [Flammula alnicola]|nr:hypothetical protein BDZ97DRAFT_1660224 [Flammula alnicola]
MELEEFSERYVEKVRNIVFDGQQKWPTPEGSEIQQWFRRVAQGPNAVRSMSTNNRMNSRLISWKTGKKFVPENLFFRTVDTSRLLPVALADFRIQWYALKDTWAWLEGRKKQAGLEPREAWQAMVLSGLMFQLVVMRNMHDYGCGDIPVVVTTWSSDQLDRALEYWTQLSTGEWSEEEQRNKFLEIDNSWCLHVQPCFTQADLLVRALLSDPEVGYVPRFIVFMSVDTKVKARALFMHPSFRPPQALVETFPTGCGGTDCTEPDCGFFDFSLCRSLAKGSKLLRKERWPKGVVRCNVWICAVEEPAGYDGPSNFQTCQRCCEVLYCCKAHQTQDWQSHKRVCEARSV